MKYAGMVLALLVSATLFAQSASRDPIQVWLTGDENSSMAAVMVHDTSGSDSMVVSVFYWTQFTNLAGPILLSKTSVQPVYKDTAIASDIVPVPANKIKSVSVTLVKNLVTKKFEGAALQGGFPQ